MLDCTSQRVPSGSVPSALSKLSRFRTISRKLIYFLLTKQVAENSMIFIILGSMKIQIITFRLNGHNISTANSNCTDVKTSMFVVIRFF